MRPPDEENVITQPNVLHWAESTHPRHTAGFYAQSDYCIMSQTTCWKKQDDISHQIGKIHLATLSEYVQYFMHTGAFEQKYLTLHR